MAGIRPSVPLLTEKQIERIVDQGIDILGKVGVFVENHEALALLDGAGQRIDAGRAYLNEVVIREAIASAPSRIAVGDRQGELALDLSGDNVHFDPGSAALHILDRNARSRREPTAEDCIHLAWVTQACKYLAAQSTGLIPSDLPEEIADRYRLFLALVHLTKPVVTGTFRKDGFAVMRDMLTAVRGGHDKLRSMPLAIFDCCPTPPLKWSDLSCQALIDGARAGRSE